MKNLNILIICSLIVHTSCMDVNTNYNGSSTKKVGNEKLESTKGFKKIQIGKNINEFDSYILSSNQIGYYSIGVINYKIDHKKFGYNKFGSAEINKINVICINEIISKITIKCKWYSSISKDLVAFYGSNYNYSSNKSRSYPKRYTDIYTWISENYLLTCNAQSVQNSPPSFFLTISFELRSFNEDIDKIERKERDRIELIRKKEALKNF